MLAKMMIEMPLPMPRSVICSPSHIKKIVPATRPTTVVKRNSMPGSCAMSKRSSAIATKVPCSIVSATVPSRV